MRLRPAPALAVAVLLLAAGLAGCGQSDEDEVRDRMATYARATAEKDYQALCDDLYARELVERLREVIPCEIALRQGLEEVQRPRLQVRRVRVDGDRAFAEVRTDARGQRPSVDTVTLVRQDDEWRIVSLAGPAPEPPSEPPPDEQ